MAELELTVSYMSSGNRAPSTCEAHLNGSEVTIIITSTPDGTARDLLARLIPPVHVERSTGTFRSPESTVDAPVQLVADLVEVKPYAGAGRVVGLMIHCVSRRAAAIGVFASSDVAVAWWQQPYNKLAKNPDVVFLTIPIVEEFSS
jgi:hypothetical protein